MKALILVVSLLLPAFAHAFQVEPMVHKLASTGTLAQAEYRVENTGSEPLAVEAVVVARSVELNTEETLTPADLDFIVMPPQATIAPGEFQLFRIRYLGDNSPIEQSTSYRIVFKQLPLQHDAEGSGVDLLFNFSTLVFVSPNGVAPLLDVTVQSDHIEFVNSGNGVADLNGSTVNLIFAQSSESLDWVDFGAFSPANFILPGQTITVPIQEEWLNDQTLTAVDIKLQ